MQGSRRWFVAAASGVLAVGAGRAEACAGMATPDWAALLVGLAADLHGPGLIKSFITRAPGDDGAVAFDRTHGNCAFVYDNAVAGLGLLACGRGDLAVRIGAALREAQIRDRFFKDGRLRNGYAAGPMPADGAYPLPGWWDGDARAWREDAYHAGTATGVLAWAMLLWCALARAGFGQGFTDAAVRAGDFIARELTAPVGFYGGFWGFEPAPQKLTWVSTEHAADLAAVFARLGQTARATHAYKLLDAVWLSGPGRFCSGLKPDGGLNDHLAVDANLWPALLPDADAAWGRGLAAVLSQCGVAGPGGLAGVDFNSDRDGIWLEGTAMAALALGRAGDCAVRARFLATLAAHTTRGRITATNVPMLSTGLATGLTPDTPDFVYYQRPHLAPLAWAVLAARNANPYTV